MAKLLARATSAEYVMPQAPPVSVEADHDTVLTVPAVYWGSVVITGTVGAVLSWREKVRADQAPTLPTASRALTW